MVFEITGPMFFGMADKIPSMEHADPEKRVLVLRMRGVPAVDTTAMNSIHKLWEECRRHEIQMVFSHVNEQPMSVFQKAGFVAEVGAEYFRPNIDAALEFAETL